MPEEYDNKSEDQKKYNKELVEGYLKAEKGLVPNTGKYWDAVYQYEAQNKLSRADADRWGILGNYIKTKKNILDFGCGWGEFIGAMKKHFPEINFTGIDISSWAIDVGKNLFTNCNFICSDKLEGENYDLILMSHILEHFKEPEKYVNDAYNRLIDDGLLLIVMPANDNEWHEHERVWTLENFRQFFKSLDGWKWILVYRPDTGANFHDGRPFEEMIAILRKVKKTQ